MRNTRAPKRRRRFAATVDFDEALSRTSCASAWSSICATRCGFAYDVVNAVLAAGADDVVDALARAEAVSQGARLGDFDAISVAFKRIKNILRQASEARQVAVAAQRAALTALRDAGGSGTLATRT